MTVEVMLQCLAAARMLWGRSLGRAEEPCGTGRGGRGGIQCFLSAWANPVMWDHLASGPKSLGGSGGPAKAAAKAPGATAGLGRDNGFEPCQTELLLANLAKMWKSFASMRCRPKTPHRSRHGVLLLDGPSEDKQEEEAEAPGRRKGGRRRRSRMLRKTMNNKNRNEKHHDDKDYNNQNVTIMTVVTDGNSTIAVLRRRR